MFKSIVANSIKEMNKDSNIIRLTRVTSFCHSMIVILLIIININSLLAKNYANGLYIGKVAAYFMQEIAKNNFITTIVIIAIIFFLIYSIIYPIGQGTIIHYIHDKKRNMRAALKKGIADFFPMFEAGFLSLIFHPAILLLIAFKILVIDGNITIPIVIGLAAWLTVLNIINTFKAYVRYIITIERLPLYESLKKSIEICRKQMSNSYRYMRVQTVLLINLSINLILIIGVPILIIYGAIALHIIQYPIIKIIVYITFFIMIIVSSYISAIIRAFFVYYWYEIYTKIIKKQHII